MGDKLLSYTLPEIATWQLNHEISTVELPALQRGFVWKVSQIESLWDSILRGFPIGSFLLSMSEDERLFLLDGQQRATSIAIGYYNPWQASEGERRKFWSLKNVPIIWIDLAPSAVTNTQKFVLRVVTQSHPWGYQRTDNASILSIADRRNSLIFFQENPVNRLGGYINMSPLDVFPYDANIPVPLIFLMQAISKNRENWQEQLILMCKENLPINHIKTKYNHSNYIESLKQALNNTPFIDYVSSRIKNIEDIVIPGIIVKNEILKSEDEQTGDDPTLFVRLNSSGTKIAGEELIYSIYKASFPETKELVENIGASFISPSIVISLVSRLSFSELNDNNYPYPISVNDFRKKVIDTNFRNKLHQFIGNESNSPAKQIFAKAFEILLSKDNYGIPPILVKTIVKASPDLFLMLLQWIKVNDREASEQEKKRIIATMTALVWFGRDNAKFTREVWKSICSNEFWTKENLSKPYFNKRDYIMFPLIQPTLLYKYLMLEVVEKNTLWDNLYPEINSEISKQYRKILSSEDTQENEIAVSTNAIWDNFMSKLFKNKSMVLFAQRKYINQAFGEFNQMETLEDTNTPWDWDHIYPSSWVYAKRYIHPNTKHWTNAIGNFRAMSLEENRSQNNSLSPKDRLENVLDESFIQKNDWPFWSKINKRINDGDDAMVKNHVTAIITRLCNIYEDWYLTLNINELFNFENEADIAN